MRKKEFLFVIFLIGIVMFMGKVGAASSSCSTSDLYDARVAASNVKITYEPYEELEDIGTKVHYLDLKIYNVSSTMLLSVKVSGDNIQTKELTLTYQDMSSDGSITLRQENTGAPTTYEITISLFDGTCAGEELRTSKITLPIYNFYSTLDVCSGIQDYYLCQPYITKELNEETFFEQVEEYRAKLEDAQAVESEDNTTIINSTLNRVSKYKYLVVGLIVAVGVVVTVIILRKKSEV